MYTTGCLEIEHGDANEGVLLLKQALEVDNAYQEPLLILSDLYPVSYTHLRAHETCADLVCRLLLEKNALGSGK
ncbi:hypothetical protein JMUB7533_26740 [Staphylococcus aureus]